MPWILARFCHLCRSPNWISGILLQALHNYQPISGQGFAGCAMKQTEFGSDFCRACIAKGWVSLGHPPLHSTKNSPDTHPSDLGSLDWYYPVIRLATVSLTIVSEFLHRHSQMNLCTVGVICKVVDKCPKCGSWLVLPIELSPRYWFLCLKLFFQSKKKL